MYARSSSRLLLLATCVLSVAAALRAAPSSPAAPPPEDVPALIRQLGDPDFRRREAATQRLKEVGKAAAPALREALGGGDPEVCARAEALLRQIERPRVPGAWFREAVGLRRVEQNFAGGRVVRVDQAGRSLVLREGAGGIEMRVTGNDGGEWVDVTVRARDAEDLRRQDPEAYELYERVARPRSGLNLRARRLVPAVPMPMPVPVPMPMPPVPGPRVGARLLPMAPPEGLVRPPGDDLMRLEARLLTQMRAARVPEAERQAVLEALRMLREIQARGAAALPQDLEAQVRKYNDLSDALRKKLEDLKLPGPGDALPPPARARLGVSVAAPDAGGGVTVTMVMPGSRGGRLGLREGDVIRRINGKAVDDAAALRRTLTDEKQPLVIDVVRNGERATLREQAPAKPE